MKIILFLVIQLIFVFLLVFLNKKFWNSRVKNYQIALFSSLIFYVTIIAITQFLNYKYKIELAAFDLNNDGFFSKEEQTELQQQAMKNVISDTGRNLAPFIGIIYALAYFLIIVLPIKVLNSKRRLEKI